MWDKQRFPLPNSATDANPAIPVSSKHARWVLNPDDGKFYIFGGDFVSGWQSLEGGQNSTLTYDPITKAWELVYPFWGIAGVPYPMGCDEVAVCWDSKRKVFWLTDGYQGNGAPASSYVGIPTTKTVFTFNPKTHEWLLPFGAAKKHYSTEKGGGQHMRSVYDAQKDRILGPAAQAGFTVMNCATGAYSWVSMTGIAGNTHVSTGQTVHLIDRLMYWAGKSGTSFGKQLFETNVDTRATRMLADLGADMYDDQDNAYIPAIDSFLVWTEAGAVSHIVSRVTGVVSAGPESPLLRDGTGYRPIYNNHHLSGNVVVGWSAAAVVAGKQLPEYWIYNPAAVADVVLHAPQNLAIESV